MARILAYTTPATGHVYPLVPGLLALRERGHEVRLIGSAEHVDELRAAGLDAMAVDPRAAEAVTDYEVEGRDRLHRGLQDLLAARERAARRPRARTSTAFAPRRAADRHDRLRRRDRRREAQGCGGRR